MSDMPEQPKTTQLPAVPEWAVELTVLVRRVSANVDNVISAVDVLRDRVNAHDQRFADQDARASKLSGGVRGLSQSDDGQNVQIAALSVKVDAIDKKIDTAAATQTQEILKAFRDAAKNPMVQKIAYAAGGLVLQALGVATTYFAMRGH